MTTLAELEVQAAKLNSEIAALKALKAGNGPVDPLPPVPKIPPIPEPRPLITLLEKRGKFVQPTARELRRLYDAVLTKHPSLGPCRDITNPIASVTGQEHYEGFMSAFDRLGYVGRAAHPDTKHYVSHWAEEAKAWLKQHRPGHSGNVAAGFLAACLAHGDIPYIVGDSSRGVCWSVGLVSFGGVQAGDAWTRVLSGNLLPPSAPAHRVVPPSNARVFVGG